MARKPDDWMPLVIGKYLADTGHLTRDQHGAYLLILMAYWTNGGPLPADDTQLAAIARASRAEWRKMKPVIAKFFTEQDGHWHQKRADEELAKAHKLVEQKSTAGRAGGIAARGKSGRKPNGETIAEPIADEWRNNTPLPLPTPKEEDDVTARERARELLSRICDRIGVVYGSDPQQITWENVVFEMLRDGVPEPDIMAAAEKTRVKGIKNINYVAQIARNPREEPAHGNRRTGKSLDDTWRGLGAFVSEDETGAGSDTFRATEPSATGAAPRQIDAIPNRATDHQGGAGAAPGPAGNRLRVAAIERDGSEGEVSTFLRGSRSSA